MCWNKNRVRYSLFYDRFSHVWPLWSVITPEQMKVLCAGCLHVCWGTLPLLHPTPCCIVTWHPSEMILNYRGWREVRDYGTCSSSRGPRFCSQYPHGDWQPFLTLVLGDQTSLLTFSSSHTLMVHRHTHTQKIKWIYILNEFITLIFQKYINMNKCFYILSV